MHQPAQQLKKFSPLSGQLWHLEENMWKAKGRITLPTSVNNQPTLQGGMMSTNQLLGNQPTSNGPWWHDSMVSQNTHNTCTTISTGYVKENEQ